MLYLKKIDELVGEDKLYPSRSELIRVAVRAYLIRELEAAKSFSSYSPPVESPPIMPAQPDPNLFVQIPLGAAANGIQEYKTFRLVKK